MRYCATNQGLGTADPSPLTVEATPLAFYFAAGDGATLMTT